jgi:hypothetical protein
VVAGGSNPGATEMIATPIIYEMKWNYNNLSRVVGRPIVH